MLIRGGPRNTAAALDALRTLVFSASNGDRPRHRNLAVIFLHATSMDEQVRYDTIRYDTRCYFNVRSKANMSQLNLPHGTESTDN